MRYAALIALALGLAPYGAHAAKKAPPRKSKPAAVAPAQVTAPARTAPSVAPQPAPETRSPFGETSKTKIAVMNLRASSEFPPEILESMASLIAQELTRMGPFAALAMQDVLQMINFESMRQSLGCDAASCLAEIGGALGADYMVSGNLALVGQSYLLQLQLMDMRESNVVARVARDYQGQPSGLLDEVRVATRLLMRDLLAKKAGSLRIVTVEEGATVSIDDVVVGVTPVAVIDLAAGTHVVILDKRGFVRFAKDVQIDEGHEARLEVVMRPSEDFVRDYREQARFQRKLAWAGVITGGVGLVTSGVLFATGASKASDLKEDIAAYNATGLRDSATARALADRDASIGRLDTLTLVSAGIGVAALTTGIVLFLTGDDPDRYEAHTTVTPSVAFDGRSSFFALSGTF